MFGLLYGHSLNMIGQILIVLGAILLASWLRKPSGSKHKLPPGPESGLPFLGHLFFLGTRPHRTLLNWSKKYGPVFSLQFGSFPAVVITDGKLIKQALSSAATAGRPAIRPFDVYSRREGIAFGDGQHNREQRRFAAKTLKDVANIGESMESRILKETDDLIENLNYLAGQSVQVHNFFNRNAVNSLLSLIINRRFEAGHPQINQLLRAVASATSGKGLLRILGLYIPQLCNWFPNATGLTSFMEWDRTISEFYKPIIEEHSATRTPGQPRDVLDVYLETVEDTSDPESSFHNGKHLVQTFKDFFAAGVETTSVTLEWIIFYLTKNTQVQNKLCSEIESVLHGRMPTLSDKPKMPCMEAVIQETLRISSILPFSIPHSALEDFELSGYMIPKGTMIIPDLFGAHHDPDAWGDPEVFRPERFLDENGRISPQSEPVLAFSTGKRSCIGEGMARNQLFLFTTRMFQCFKVTAVKNVDSNDQFASVMCPPNFEVVFEKRSLSYE